MDSAITNIDRRLYGSFSKVPFPEVIEGLVLAVLIFYSSTFAMKLPPRALEYMATTPAKIAALAAIFAIATKRLTMSVALAVGIFASLNASQHRGFWEQFNEEREQDTPQSYKSPSRIVPGPAFKDAMFKMRQRIRLEKAAGVTTDDNIFQTAPYGFDVAS